MYTASCDFCAPNPANIAEVPTGLSTPKGWLPFRIVCGVNAYAGPTRLMCPECATRRNIEIKPHTPLKLADAILEELDDGIRDIVSDMKDD